MPEFFSRWLWTSFLWNLFCLKIFLHFFVSSGLWNLFCKSNVAAHKKLRAAVFLHRKLTSGSSFYNVGACKTQIYLRSLRRTPCKSQIFKVGNKVKPHPIISSLTCNLLKMDVYSNDFQKQIAASVNALNHFYF